jgi:hypothetical protein
MATRQQLIAGGNRTDPLKTQFLDQAILQGLVGAPTRPFACGVLAHKMSMLRACSERPNWVMPSPWTAPALLTRKTPCLSL